jgi:hypothetical protein
MTTDDALAEASKIVTDWSDACKASMQRLTSELETFAKKLEGSNLSPAARQAVLGHVMREMDKAQKELEAL